ncbi:MAG: ribonuclease HI, partial [Anaerolineales bacterium]
MVVEGALNIYVDGSSRRNRHGGVGFLFVLVDQSGNETVVEPPPVPGYTGVTNSEMELKACILALKEARERSWPAFVQKIVIHTDSTYVERNVGYALSVWPKQQWR